MTTRDELRDQVRKAILARHLTGNALAAPEADEAMPLVDAYVAEKLAERQEAIAQLVEQNRSWIPYTLDAHTAKVVIELNKRMAHRVRDFGKEAQR